MNQQSELQILPVGDYQPRKPVTAMSMGEVLDEGRRIVNLKSAHKDLMAEAIILVRKAATRKQEDTWSAEIGDRSWHIRACNTYLDLLAMHWIDLGGLLSEFWREVQG